MSYLLDSGSEDDIIYYIDGEFVGVGEQGHQYIYDYLSELPDGTILELTGETCVIFTPGASETLLDPGFVRGSSQSTGNYKAFPVGRCGIVELVKRKKMLVVDKGITFKGL